MHLFGSDLQLLQKDTKIKQKGKPHNTTKKNQYHNSNIFFVPFNFSISCLDDKIKILLFLFFFFQSRKGTGWLE